MKADTKAIQAIHEHVITHNPRVTVSHSDLNTWNLHIKSVTEDDRGGYMCQLNTGKRSLAKFGKSKCSDSIYRRITCLFYNLHFIHRSDEKSGKQNQSSHITITFNYIEKLPCNYVRNATQPNDFDDDSFECAVENSMI